MFHKTGKVKLKKKKKTKTKKKKKKNTKNLTTDQSSISSLPPLRGSLPALMHQSRSTPSRGLLLPPISKTCPNLVAIHQSNPCLKPQSSSNKFDDWKDSNPIIQRRPNDGSTPNSSDSRITLGNKTMFSKSKVNLGQCGLQRTSNASTASSTVTNCKSSRLLGQDTLPSNDHIQDDNLHGRTNGSINNYRSQLLENDKLQDDHGLQGQSNGGSLDSNFNENQTINKETSQLLGKDNTPSPPDRNTNSVVATNPQEQSFNDSSGTANKRNNSLILVEKGILSSTNIIGMGFDNPSENQQRNERNVFPEDHVTTTNMSSIDDIDTRAPLAVAGKSDNLLTKDSLATAGKIVNSKSVALQMPSNQRMSKDKITGDDDLDSRSVALQMPSTDQFTKSSTTTRRMSANPYIKQGKFDEGQCSRNPDNEDDGYSLERFEGDRHVVEVGQQHASARNSQLVELTNSGTKRSLKLSHGEPSTFCDQPERECNVDQTVSEDLNQIASIGAAVGSASSLQNTSLKANENESRSTVGDNIVESIPNINNTNNNNLNNSRHNIANLGINTNDDQSSQSIINLIVSDHQVESLESSNDERVHDIVVSTDAGDDSIDSNEEHAMFEINSINSTNTIPGENSIGQRNSTIADGSSNSNANNYRPSNSVSSANNIINSNISQSINSRDGNSYHQDNNGTQSSSSSSSSGGDSNDGDMQGMLAAEDDHQSELDEALNVIPPPGPSNPMIGPQVVRSERSAFQMVAQQLARADDEQNDVGQIQMQVGNVNNNVEGNDIENQHYEMQAEAQNEPRNINIHNIQQRQRSVPNIVPINNNDGIANNNNLHQGAQNIPQNHENQNEHLLANGVPQQSQNYMQPVNSQRSNMVRIADVISNASVNQQENNMENRNIAEDNISNTNTDIGNDNISVNEQDNVSENEDVAENISSNGEIEIGDVSDSEDESW